MNSSGKVNHMNKRKRSLIECIIVSGFFLVFDGCLIIRMLKTDNGFDRTEPLYYIAIGFLFLFIVLIIAAIRELKQM